MMPQHYTYYLIADEPYFQGLIAEGLPVLYAGVRTCRCPIEEDPYMGSSEYVKAAMVSGITFTKTVIEKHLTRKRANKHEMEILSKLKNDTNSAVWDLMFNRNVPGEFGEHSRVGIVFKAVYKRASALNVKRSNRRGGVPLGYEPTEDHRNNVASSISNRWGLIRMFCSERGIDKPGKGGCNIDFAEFNAWRDSLASAAVIVADSKGLNGNNSSPKTAFAEPKHPIQGFAK